MENNEIYVPILPWLIGGSRIGGTYNIYCSSFGTDPKEGCYGKKIFNYRIWIEKIDEEEYLKVCCYYGLGCFESQNQDDIAVETYPLTDEGRELVRAYILTKKDEFFSE